MNLRRDKWLGVLSLVLLSYILTFGQTVSGVVMNENKQPIPGVELEVSPLGVRAFTNGAGVFRFFDLPDGDYTLTSTTLNVIDPVTFTVAQGQDVDLGMIDYNNTDFINSSATDISVISIDDLEQIEEDESSAVSSMLTASRDPYDQAVAFNLSPLRYRARGYNNEDVEQYLNGMPVNDLDDGRVFWNSWGGLNDVLRVQTNNLNLRPTDFTFGGLGGASLIDLRASVQRVQQKLVYTFSNRSYGHRLMYTHSTGMMENGWAFTLSGSKRWAQEGYVPGTHYDSYSYFASIDKKLNSNQTLNFVFLGAPLRRGRTGPSVQEAYDLAGSNFYNPNWGYQNGEVRNSREERVHQPIAMLRHDWMISDKTKVMTTLGMQTGRFGTTRLDWYLAPDPRPDYYRKLPSFQNTPEAAAAVGAYFSSSEANRQLNWDRMFQVNRGNYTTIEDVDGIEGNDVSGNLAGYVVEEQRFDSDKFTFNTILTHVINNQWTLNGGLSYLNETTHNFKVLDDLLGADFYIDFDDFAIRDFPNNEQVKQNDLNNPNRLLREGDVFGWNYDIKTQNLGGWGQLQYSGRNWDVFGSALLQNTSFYREGFTKVGKFPDNSEGKSNVYSFLNYGAKAGITYKIDGRNYLYAVGGYKTRAPFSRFAYLSPRTRDEVVDGVVSEKILSGEAGYNFRYPRLKGRISGFYTQFNDQLDNSSFYFDEANTFVNYIMTGIDKRHTGLEAGFEWTLPYGFNIKAGGGIAENVFTSRPTATLTQDNSAALLGEDRIVFQKNFYVPGSPQTGASLTFEYRAKNYWFVNITGSYVDRLYLDFNPDRRTIPGVAPVSKTENPELWNSIVAQERVPAAFTVNVFGGKSWIIKGYYTAINLSVSNVLNNTDIITGGFEQFRFDYVDKDVNRFPPRYFYGFGRNFSLNFSFAL